jgi:hypothetical protein
LAAAKDSLQRNIRQLFVQQKAQPLYQANILGLVLHPAQGEATTGCLLLPCARDWCFVNS